MKSSELTAAQLRYVSHMCTHLDITLICPKVEASEMCEMGFLLIRCYYSCLPQSFPRCYENHVRPVLTSGVADPQYLAKMYG